MHRSVFVCLFLYKLGGTFHELCPLLAALKTSEFHTIVLFRRHRIKQAIERFITWSARPISYPRNRLRLFWIFVEIRAAFSRSSFCTSLAQLGQNGIGKTKIKHSSKLFIYKCFNWVVFHDFIEGRGQLQPPPTRF